MLYITEEEYADLMNIDIKSLLFGDDVNIQDTKIDLETSMIIILLY